MAWVTPRTWATLESITAAKLNEIRDALNDLDRRTAASSAFVGTLESTATNPYVDLATAGPSVVVTIGTNGGALIALMCTFYNNTINIDTFMGVNITGATTIATSDDRALRMPAPAANAPFAFGATFLQGGLTAGSNTFTSKYRVGGAGTGFWSQRRILVTALSA